MIRHPRIAQLLVVPLLLAGVAGCGLLPAAKKTVETTIAPQTSVEPTLTPTPQPSTSKPVTTVTTSAPPPATVTVTQQTTVPPPPTTPQPTSQAPAGFIRAGNCGITAEIPAFLVANGTGGYSSRAGGVTFSCRQGNGTIEQALSAIRGEKQSKGYSVTASSVVSPTQFLVSGFQNSGQTIYYTRGVYRGGKLYLMEWQYGVGNREYDEYVERSVATIQIT